MIVHSTRLKKWTLIQNVHRQLFPDINNLSVCTTDTYARAASDLDRTSHLPEFEETYLYSDCETVDSESEQIKGIEDKNKCDIPVSVKRNRLKPIAPVGNGNRM